MDMCSTNSLSVVDLYRGFDGRFCKTLLLTVIVRTPRYGISILGEPTGCLTRLVTVREQSDGLSLRMWHSCLAPKR